MQRGAMSLLPRSLLRAPVALACPLPRALLAAFAPPPPRPSLVRGYPLRPVRGWVARGTPN